jgi:hypothetical protein
MDIDKKAKIIWDYMRMNMPFEKADAIFVLCSHDTRVADRAADLFNDGYAPWVIVSGGAGKLTQDLFLFKNRTWNVVPTQHSKNSGQTQM